MQLRMERREAPGWVSASIPLLAVGVTLLLVAGLVWLAGAGVRAPYSYGATDELGFRAVENVATIYDLHATLLHLAGLDHERLTFYHNGIERRLTDVHGDVLRGVLAS